VEDWAYCLNKLVLGGESLMDGLTCTSKVKVKLSLYRPGQALRAPRG
jgi:hypothetical protein